MSSSSSIITGGDTVLRPGPCALEHDVGADGSADQRTSFTYDEAGRVVRVDVDADVDGLLDAIAVHTYNADGTLAAIVEDSDVDGLPDHRTEYVYEMGRLVRSQRVRLADGRTLRASTFMHDAMGRVLTESVDEFADTIVDAIITTVWGADGTVSQVNTDRGADGRTDETCALAYDAAGLLSTRTCTSAGAITVVRRYFHDAVGNLVAEEADFGGNGSVEAFIRADYACFAAGSSSSSSSGQGSSSSEMGASSSSVMGTPLCVAVEDETSGPSSPQDVPAGCARFSLLNVAISPSTEERYLTVHLNQGTILTAESYVEGPGRCSTADTLLDLYASPLSASPGRAYCTVDNPGRLGCDDDGGDGACSFLRYVSPAAQDVVLRLASVGNSTSIADVSVALTIRTPGCGDAVIDPGEQCDDGNRVPGDGCGMGCTIEGDACASPVVVTLAEGSTVRLGPLDTAAAMQDFTASCGTGSSTAPDVVFELRPSSAGVLTAQVRPLTGWDPVLSLAATCSATTTSACVNAGMANVTEQLVTSIGTGSQWLRVDGAAGTSGAFELSVSLAAVRCGDGVVSTGEQCDDGNTVGGDGCSATCTSECAVMEVTGNAFMSPQSIPASCRTWNLTGGSISPIGDDDYFLVQLQAGQRITAESFTGSFGSCSADTVLMLYGYPRADAPTGVGCGTSEAGRIGCSDDDGVGRCSLLSFTAASTGTYLLRIIDFFSDDTISNYGIRVTIQ